MQTERGAGQIMHMSLIVLQACQTTSGIVQTEKQTKGKPINNTINSGMLLHELGTFIAHLDCRCERSANNTWHPLEVYKSSKS